MTQRVQALRSAVGDWSAIDVARIRGFLALLLSPNLSNKVRKRAEPKEQGAFFRSLGFRETQTHPLFAAKLLEWSEEETKAFLEAFPVPAKRLPPVILNQHLRNLFDYAVTQSSGTPIRTTHVLQAIVTLSPVARQVLPRSPETVKEETMGKPDSAELLVAPRVWTVLEDADRVLPFDCSLDKAACVVLKMLIGKNSGMSRLWLITNGVDCNDVASRLNAIMDKVN